MLSGAFCSVQVTIHIKVKVRKVKFTIEQATKAQMMFGSTPA
jgi:hypothetical protein